MHARDQPCALAITLVVLLQQLPRLFVQRRVWIRVDEEALDGHEDVPDPIRRLPVLFERVHADLARARHIRMENLRREPTCHISYHRRQWADTTKDRRAPYISVV